MSGARGSGRMLLDKLEVIYGMGVETVLGLQNFSGHLQRFLSEEHPLHLFFWAFFCINSFHLLFLSSPDSGPMGLQSRKSPGKNVTTFEYDHQTFLAEELYLMLEIKGKPSTGDLSTQGQCERRDFLAIGMGIAAGLFSGEVLAAPAPDMKRDPMKDPMRDPLQDLKQPPAFDKQQSPRTLDLTKCQRKDLADIAILEGGRARQIVRSGHGLKVEMHPGSALKSDGVIYHLQQFHFHTPSEHAVITRAGEEPRRFAGEIHFVHKSDKGAAAVIGVFVKVGRENKDLAFILNNAPGASAGTSVCNQRFTPLNLLPKQRVPIHYEGSLTTSPFNGPINWQVLVNPIEISAAQFKRLHAIVGDNARALQQGKTPVTLDTNVK